jgi:hypothetical protein
VAERVFFDKVLERKEDFDQLLRLLDVINPPLGPGQRSDLVLYAALQAHKLITENRSKIEALQEKIQGGSPLEDLLATIET